MKNLKGRLGKLEEHRNARAAKRSATAFWDALASGNGLAALAPDEYPPGVLERLEQLEREGWAAAAEAELGAIERRTQEALERSTREHEERQRQDAIPGTGI